MKWMRGERGTITLEASIVVPFFVMLMLVLNGAFVLFMGQQIITHTLIQTAKSLALDPYLTQRIADSGVKLDDLFGDLISLGSEGYYSTQAWYKDPDKLEDMVEERYMKYLSGADPAVGGGDATGSKTLLELLGVEGAEGGLDFSGCTVEDGVLTLKLKYKQTYLFDGMGLAPFTREIGVKVKLFGVDQGS